MGRSFIDALHRKRVQGKFVHTQQPKKHKAFQTAIHKSRAITALSKNKSAYKNAKIHKKSNLFSRKSLPSKQLNFKSNTKPSINFLRAKSNYKKDELTKKVNYSVANAKKINSLPLPRSLSVNRYHQISPSLLTSRGKIKAAAKRAKLQHRLSSSGARLRSVAGSNKQKKSNTVTRTAKKLPANRHRFIRFFHAMMSTGKIPNKPSARSSKIKKLWKLVHHRKTHAERVRLGEDILNGKLTPAKMPTRTSSASRKPMDQFNKMKFKASNFKFAIVPANKNKGTKSISSKSKA